MTDLTPSPELDAISEIEAYAKAKGLSASTVCVRATGNSRLIDRLARRASQTASDLERVRNYIAENPAPKNEKGAAQ